MSVSRRPDGPGSVPFPISPTTGAVTVDASRAEGQTLTLTGDANITFAGFVTGRLMTVRMFVTQGAHAITWPASVHWLRGTPPPALTSSSEVTFTSIDGGATILADYEGHTEPDIQDFIASGTWTKPAGARWICVELIGGGGGGSSNSTGVVGGGGGGGYLAAWFSADDLAATEPVVVGAGGAAAAAGGSSSFGPLTVMGGAAGTTGGAGAGGLGGLGLYPGGKGADSAAAAGGSSLYGGGGGAGYGSGGLGGGDGGSSKDPAALLGGDGGGYAGFSSPGLPGTAPGGGGSGGNESGIANGGAGARGQVRVTSYF